MSLEERFTAEEVLPFEGRGQPFPKGQVLGTKFCLDVVPVFLGDLIKNSEWIECHDLSPLSVRRLWSQESEDVVRVPEELGVDSAC